MNGLDLWREPWPRNLHNRELESCRRRVVLGNHSGLWDALLRCSEGVTGGWALAAPQWLSEALAEAIAHAPPAGAAIPPEEFARFSPLLLEHLRSIRTGIRGRHARWWARWKADLTDLERADALEHAREQVRPEARKALARYRRLVPSREDGQAEALEEAIAWEQRKLELTVWSDAQVAATVALQLPGPHKQLSGRAVLASWQRVRDSSEPWRYQLGPLATAVLATSRRVPGHRPDSWIERATYRTATI